MEAKGEYRIASDRQRVWTALNDPGMLQKCIPGCQALEPLGENAYQARIAASIGPVRATFDTQIRLEDLRPPASYRLVGESKAGAAGFGRGTAEVQLQEEGDGTLLQYRAEFRVGGKLAQVGSRLVLGATRKMADDFFGCLARALDEGAVPATPPEAAAPRGRAAWVAWLAAGLVAALLAGWFLLR